MPDTYGIAKHPCFCFRDKPRVDEEEQLPLAHSDFDRNPASPIKLNGLTKKFGEMVAVDKLSLDIQQNEVMTLLGHNGAGKTTAIYMLTGILKPTSGDASIYGNSLKDDIDGVR